MNNTYQNKRDHQKTDAWFAANGISPKSLHIGTAEVFQAQKLATNTLRSHPSLLEAAQVKTLNEFLRKACSPKHRQKITQSSCYAVMNIAKQVQRRDAQRLKKLRRRRSRV
jgi:hypothetical protein